MYRALFLLITSGTLNNHDKTHKQNLKGFLSSHTCSHTLPPQYSPLLPWPHTPPHPRSLTHPSDVSWSKMPAGSTLIALKDSSTPLGTRRDGSQPSNSPPAHARRVHQRARACAPCTCAMHMHVCTVALSLSAHVRTVHACAHVHVPLTQEYNIPMRYIYIGLRICMCVYVYIHMYTHVGVCVY